MKSKLLQKLIISKIIIKTGHLFFSQLVFWCNVNGVIVYETISNQPIVPGPSQIGLRVSTTVCEQIGQHDSNYWKKIKSKYARYSTIMLNFVTWLPFNIKHDIFWKVELRIHIWKIRLYFIYFKIFYATILYYIF